MNSPDTTAITDIPITALHASSIRAMSEFVRQPSAALAQTVLRLLAALNQHPDRFIAPCGHNVYRQAITVWRQLADNLAHCCEDHPPPVLH